MKESPLISVVIGIRNWEPERLDLAIRSHIDSSIGKNVELIISDYGSSNPVANKVICENYDCVYKHTDADIWSRSRALNVGLTLARSNLMVTTDADIIFAPYTLEATVEFLLSNSNSIVLAQCADLSQGFTLDRAKSLPWEEIYADAVLRPRWGMGGLCAFSRDTLEAVRGFEERMVVWGSEDNDFVKRCRQAGRYMHWIAGADIGIYHVWHPPYLETKTKSNDIHLDNKKILTGDSTTVRNYLGPACYRSDKPLISINIASYNRGHLLGDVIRSLLNQTVQDFEILIYDDGSVDNTAEVVASFDDTRLRFFPNTKNAGVATARNRMLEESLGQFICVHDDDDIMLPNRLELQLNAMTEGVVGNYGGWVDYDSETGELTRQPGKEPFGLPAVTFLGSSLAHGTLFIQTDVMKRIGYETSFRGGSDYNLAFRLAAAGYKLKHCGDYVILRRVHAVSLTGQSSDTQKLSSRITVAPFLNNISNNVESMLRTESKKAKPAEIHPVYDNFELTKYLPKDIFDYLVDVSDIAEVQIEPAVSFYGVGSKPRHFVLQTTEGPSLQLPYEISCDAFCRIPKLTIDEDHDFVDVDKYLHDICHSLGQYLDARDGGVAVVMQYSSIVSEDIQIILDAHAHLINSVILVEYLEKKYIIVDSSSSVISSFVAYNIRSLFGSIPCASQVVPTASHLISVENDLSQELH